MDEVAGHDGEERRIVHSVRFADLGERMGAWDPETGTIWLARGLTSAERRCTLVHEQIHAERGDEACVTPWHDDKQEFAVEVEAARRLVHLEALADALSWAQDEWEVAVELHVDVQTVRARICGLSVAERRRIEMTIDAKGEVA